MRITHSPTTTPQRVFDPSTQFIPSSAAQRKTASARPALRDGFESTLSKSTQGGVQSLFREQFGALATDKQQFHETMRGIFGEGYDATKAEQYRQQALAGNFDWLPQVEWVEPGVLGGANGAYDSESGKVLLNRELQGNPSLAASTFVEEAGHHLDAQLNTVDSKGDEGELFRRVLGGEKLTQAQVAEIRAENDKGTIQLHGKSVEVEFWNPFKAAKKAIDWVGEKASDVAQWVADKVPVVVDTVADGAKWVGKAAGKVINFLGLGPQRDRKFDGMLVGAGNQTFPPGTPLDQIPGVTPDGNPNPPRTVLYVNGIDTNLDWQSRNEMQWIANATNSRVIGIHNATEGMGVDLIQCLNDKKDKGTNPAVDTLADTVYSELKAGREVHLMGYSQGGLITARALKHLAERLRIEDGLSQDQVEQAMSRIRVETFGSAAAVYPDGPQYVHYVNDKDLVPNLFGLGLPEIPVLTHPGRGAVVHHFSEKDDPHQLGSTYLWHRVDFDRARRGEFG